MFTRKGIIGEHGECHELKYIRYAEVPSSRLRVPIKLSSGDVGIYFMQSPHDRPLGVARCWVDDNVAGGVDLYGTANVDDTIATWVFHYHFR